jgi:4-oxalocrotonate tautomerase
VAKASDRFVEMKEQEVPLVRIELAEGTPQDFRDAVVEVIYNALTEIAGAPANDKFMIVSEHKRANLVMDPHYVVDRTEQALIIQITFNAGRTLDVKKQLYRAIADGLHERVGLRTEDVFINLIEVPKENWSFGRGEAQYA